MEISIMKTRIKNLKQAIKDGRVIMTPGQKKQLGNYGSMLRNIAEDGCLGGETFVSLHGVENCDRFLKQFNH